MNVDAALAPLARVMRLRAISGGQRGANRLALPAPKHWEWLVLGLLATFFVLVGAIDLDLGPSEARLGLAAGEQPGPLGQVVGYWAPDLWPAKVVPSYILALIEPGGRPTSAAVRWPAAIGGNPCRVDLVAQDGAFHGDQRGAPGWLSAGSEAWL